MITDAGAYPSPRNYGKFPKSVCTSVNEVICHGIPDDRKLEEGDIVNIDVTVFLEGYHGDTSRTFFVGNVRERWLRTCSVLLAAACFPAFGPGVVRSARRPNQPLAPASTDGPLLSLLKRVCRCLRRPGSSSR